MSEALKIINDKLTDEGINYEFGVWTSDIVNPYFVGEYAETESFTEDGLRELTFMLNGFTKGSWLQLEQARTTIEKLFSNYTQITESGTGVSIEYANSLIIPTGDADFKRIQINLSIKEWRVNNT